MHIIQVMIIFMHNSQTFNLPTDQNGQRFQSALYSTGCKSAAGSQGNPKLQRSG